MDKARLKGMTAAAARREHGTRARYIAGCHCMLCRAANSRYQTGRDTAKRKGDYRGLVSAEEVRRFCRYLSSQGIGYKSVAAAAGYCKTSLQEILAGRRTRIRAHFAARILQVDKSAIADSANISAAPTWKLIDELLEDGYTKLWIARQLGYTGEGLQFHRGPSALITAFNASRVERLYHLIKAGRVSR